MSFPQYDARSFEELFIQAEEIPFNEAVSFMQRGFRFSKKINSDIYCFTAGSPTKILHGIGDINWCPTWDEILNAKWTVVDFDNGSAKHAFFKL